MKKTKENKLIKTEISENDDNEEYFFFIQINR